MDTNSNDVNITDRRYHHGDLRAALIATGLRMLAERDAETLSLREIARTVGVSATSVYRHFSDRQALMAALAAEGLAQLAAAQRSAAAAEAGGPARLAATGRAYVRFALANPALFRLIFGKPARAGAGQALKSDTDTITFLKENAAAASAADPGGPPAPARAVKAWALVHGLAMLMLDGQILADPALIDAIIPQ